MIKNVVITISESCLDRLKSVADALHQEGLTITNLYEFGVIIGHADDKVINILRKHEEIISLTEQKYISISPPDSEIQ